MPKLTEIIIVLVILLVLMYLYNLRFTLDTNIYTENEGFRVNSQNYPYNNAYDIAERLEYGEKNDQGIYNKSIDPTMGPSSLTGVNQNSPQDVFDNRGYKWTANANDPQVDVITRAVDDKMLRQQFERTYMLDPDGSVAQYDPTYMKISPNCCPAQYAPPFKLTDKDESNCDFAQKYVANNYSGMNFQDGYGCVCMTPKEADFYGTRGGNTD